MGLSGLILKKQENINIYELLHDVRLSAEQAGLEAFLYEYLKLNPEDIFWDELDWFYTYEDIVKIKQKEFNPYWCYENPHTDNEESD